MPSGTCSRPTAPSSRRRALRAWPAGLTPRGWRPLHTRIVLALAIGWALDSFEIQIIGKRDRPDRHRVPPLCRAEDRLVLDDLVHRDHDRSGWLRLSRRQGRPPAAVSATLILYAVAAVLTATSWNFTVFMIFRFATALGVGGEYAAVSSAMAEFVPARYRAAPLGES